jgi:hypothetical protein
MRYVDFSIQLLLMVAGVVLVIFSVKERDVMFLFLIVQFVLGAWQFGGSLFRLLLNDRRRQLKSYLIVSSVYLVVLAMINTLFGSDKWFYETDINLLITTVPAWLLAGYYFFLTCAKTFVNRESGKFLRHISF